MLRLTQFLAKRNVAYWHETDMPTALLNVRFPGAGGKYMLALSFSGFDPTET
jgi:hypothetical protein